jgi:hypothetical protein
VHSHWLLIGGIYERGFVFFSVIFLLKFRKMGSRTKLPKSPRSLPPQVFVDLSALENFQPRPVNTFSVARNAYNRYFINKHRFKVGFLAHPDLT